MGHRVESELVANVIAVQVAADQQVAVGDELVLLESMKMEIPVLAGVIPGFVLLAFGLWALAPVDAQG